MNTFGFQSKVMQTFCICIEEDVNVKRESKQHREQEKARKEEIKEVTEGKKQEGLCVLSCGPY